MNTQNSFYAGVQFSFLIGDLYQYTVLSDHECSIPGCKNVLVIDGNMKNRRDVCAASEAGFVEYEGLPGMIKTGCQLSPVNYSKYCYEHAPRISVRTQDQLPDRGEEGVVRLITAKKTTRNDVFYQVHVFVYGRVLCSFYKYQ